MYRLPICFLIFFLLSTFAYCQSSAIIGNVVNEQKEPLEFVSVALLKQNDSTLVNYTITDVNGYFKITEVPNSPLIVQFSNMGYETQSKYIDFKNEPIDFKTVTLLENLSVLGEITISAVIPIQIKKDTIAFNASSFKVNPDDNLESLLKKLPGVDIESDGKVTAQGNEVTKIFVDGKEFFGGDPSIVLKNLSADAISKIEVIDKKSDEAELTGVDDGNKQVVINFTLKKSKKKQGFGKASAGMGLDSRYFSNLNYNKFSPKTQFSIIGKFNNINVTGSSIQGFLENSNGIADESDDENAAKQNTKSLSGFLKTGVSGVNIGHEFKNKESFNADYFYNLSDNSGTSNSKRISFSQNNNFDYESEDTYHNTSNNHNLNLNYENKANKTNSLIIKGQITSNKRTSNTETLGSYLNELSELTTTNNQTLFNDNDNKSANFNINYNKKLQKTGRSFSTAFSTYISESARDNEQTTFNNRNINTNNPSYREIFTFRDETFNTETYNFNFRFREPLGKNHYLNLQSFLTTKNDKEDINQLKTTVTNNNAEELLIYKYKHIEDSYRTRLAHSFNSEKFNIFNGLELQYLNRTFGVINDVTLSKHLVYLNPVSTIQFKPKKGSKYKLVYKRIIKNPRSSESSTIINDLNPYFIRQGNPDLKPEKMDDISFIANIFEFKSNLNFTSKISYQFSKDAIVQNIDIADDFVKTRSYQNSGNRERFSSEFSFGKKINGLGLRYTIKNKNLYGTSNSIINLELNDVISKDFLIGLALENNNKNVIDLKFGANYSVNNTSFSLEKDLNRTYKKQQYFTNLDYDLSKKLNVNTQFDYIVFSDNQFASNVMLPIWNAAISYNVSKRNSNILKLVLIDLLDKNLDVYRRSTTNFFEETNSESLGRYIILSYTYKLSTGPKKKK
ncbi:outer membrane beta-barrel protein [Mariniflexile sp. AS56]|uniref:outer membrane beta-barrel protein n=1 Tax=Mariniflexile sp. AS56 TaxID=3063957 RepID=UPI0026F36D26|nr:outer membrane beta-barrel protein [Mariniflexile sp. AS56]MDO7173158.1 outer membrane beta-barrel protein [Mariniflexile sp. AS56]